MLTTLLVESIRFYSEDDYANELFLILSRARVNYAASFLAGNAIAFDVLLQVLTKMSYWRKKAFKW